NNVGFKITGNKSGYYNVYSRNGSSSRMAKLQITYIINTTPVAVTGINFSCSKPSVVIDTNTPLSANVLPINATNKVIIWTSSNPSIASISSSGTLNALNIGTTTITATTQDGNYTKSCDITITGVPNNVIYKWSGALMPNSIKINAKLTNETSNARAVVSTSPTMSNPIYSTAISVTNTTNRMGTFMVNGLQPNTSYYYAIESNGIIDMNTNSIGRFTTPKNGAHSYSFTVGACNYDSSRPVWQKIFEKNPLFMMVMGDLHYGNPGSLSASRTEYENRILNVTNTKNFFNAIPIVTVWDDHDYAGDGSSSTSSNKNGAKQAFREYIPHYNFGDNNANPAIYQSFVIGRVRYIMMDLRSERTSSLICSNEQVEWFKNECLTAKANNEIVAWVSSFGITSSSSDSWGGNTNYRTQRNAIFNFLKNENIQNLFIISGDAHMAGIDDGQNTDCLGIVNSNNCVRTANSTNPIYPLLQSAPIYPLNISQKGIVTNILPMTGQGSTGQYSKIEIIDDGDDTIKICFTVYRVNNSGMETILGTYCFERNLNVETIIENQEVLTYNSPWKYYDNGQLPATNWNQVSYNDNTWNMGNAALGYGTGGITTTVSFGSSSSNKHITTYFRKNITLENTSEISNVSLKARIDDGVVFYLNGTEIGRTSNIPQNQTNSTLATSLGNNGSSEVTIPIDILAFKTALIEGNNVLSAEVHQQSRSSSDIYFDTNLNIVRNLMVNNTGKIVTKTPSQQKEIKVIETNKNNSIEIFPNPSSGKLFLKNSTTDFDNRKLLVYALSGNLVATHNFKSNIQQQEFDLSKLNSQVYLIIVTENDSVIFSKKWIKK
ncbi:MAG: Ig-like domain-containing protein, partial [Moheibacter sp.]